LNHVAASNVSGNASLIAGTASTVIIDTTTVAVSALPTVDRQRRGRSRRAASAIRVAVLSDAT
jgi:hypothetical protein